MERITEDLADEGLALPFSVDLSALKDRLREKSELAAEPLVFTQKAIIRGFKLARSYMSALADVPALGDNYPSERAMVYARLDRRQ